MRNFLLILMLAWFGTALKAQPTLFARNPEKPRLVSGPVVGAVTSTTANIWIAYKGSGQNMMTLIDTADKTVYYPTGFNKINRKKDITALTMYFNTLKPYRFFAIYVSRCGQHYF